MTVEGKGRRVIARPRFHFDECQGAPAACDDVNFAAGYPGAPRKDSPAVQAEIERGEAFCAAAALFGLLAVHFERSRARA